MKKLILTITGLLAFNALSAQGNPNNEVIYHVFQRSFFDSNGDGHGDLEGIRQKLDYIQKLGATSILLTPLYASDFYHNYFASDFETIDPEYGTLAEYTTLVEEVHKRKMKIYQDVEMQYVAGTHPWFKDSYKNPASAYSKYLMYNDAKNEKPGYFYDVPEFTTYNNRKEQIIVVNMKDQKVKDYTVKMLKYWADPNGDGKFTDGVDGYRLDHMMDNLDNANKLTNLFKDFWTPVLAEVKKVNPNLKIVAEQADWGSYGYDYLTKGSVDRIFAFRLKQAIGTFDKESIIAAADSTFNYLPEHKLPFVFIENHDTNRFASEPGVELPKLKIAAALNLLIGGVPSIYYGQELGMKGTRLDGKTDGNDIPIREGFEWYAAGEGPGMALWYKNTGEWWDKRNMKPNDGISLEEAEADPNSLYNYYKKLLYLRRTEEALINGRYENVPNRSENVLSFVRTSKIGQVLVVINLSGKDEAVLLEGNDIVNFRKLRLLSGNEKVTFMRGGRSINMPAYGIQVWKVL
ncbi:alpha-amylase family glycosyl hydrolase [Flavobacterium akiainvivens]|uniref:alpha-amylase family glycosyl hydrolase n=1 Tax=Flavobacterium akiainvivens TaxID=1202724 RepID=UPI0006C8D031|nr:alpha-amylase family glycosyl hydrolase [Flavobacterium akiainvivens]SFQ65520.1 Glycosidase [Flavobacterium akiainvivens]